MDFRSNKEFLFIIENSTYGNPKSNRAGQAVCETTD